MKKALITGITGQDGSYLAEFLLNKGYEVHGIVRRASTFNTPRLDHLYKGLHKRNPNLFLHYGDISDSEQIAGIIYNVKPSEIYHLAAQSHVRVSFDMPEFTSNVTGLGITRILEAMRRSRLKARLYQASSSEMFGAARPPQSEHTAFKPRSPYACAKAYAFWMVVNYRDGYDLYATNGVLFNHESPRRGENFVTRKVTMGVARIVAGKQKKLYLGNLNAGRDWGYAPEYVEMMWQMLALPKPGDYVVGTGEAHTVKEFVSEAFKYVGLNWKKYVEIDPRYFRPTETETLIADASKARKALGWKPKIVFPDLVKIMMDADMRAQGVTPVGEGDRILAKKFPRRWWSVD